jgi:sugar phosphate isomerase/epimerase
VNLAIQTSRLPGTDLSEQFAAAARFGFDGVEVAVGPTFDLAERLDDVRRASETSGLPICAICTHSMHDPLLPDPEERARRFAGLADLLRMADEIGARGVVSVPVRPAHAFPDMVDRDRELADLAVAEFSQWAATLPPGRSAVFLEPLNRYETFFVRRVEQAVALAERISHPRVMVLGDLFHMNIEESHLGEPLRRAGRHLGHVHVADNNRLEPGQGCLDFRTPFAALKAIGYQGYLAIECSRLSGAPDTALPATVRFLRDQWARA